MKENLIGMKAWITAFLTAAGAFLGWKGSMLAAWAAVMGLDYVSGTMAACKGGNWSSATAREGLWHKGGMILVVTVAAIADAVMVMLVTRIALGMDWPGLILPLVLAWYIMTELGSILENAVKMGARVPQFLLGILKAGIHLTESAGETARESIQ